MKRNSPWWAKKWGQDKICGITQTRLRPGSNQDKLSYTIKLKCGHAFYRNPLKMWSEVSPTCPMCRKLIEI